MFHVRDIMTTHIVTVTVDDTIDKAISLMVKHRISGLPVVDHAGRVVGVISEFDLLELICDGQPERDLVVHFMSGNPCSVQEGDSWMTLVDLFRAKRVRRLPVLRGGRLVGIVTRHDLMHAIRDARRQLQRGLAKGLRDRKIGRSGAAAPAAPIPSTSSPVDSPASEVMHGGS